MVFQDILEITAEAFVNGLHGTSVNNILRNTTTLLIPMFQTSSSAIVSVTLKFLQDVTLTMAEDDV